jgi:hypothetical protein
VIDDGRYDVFVVDAVPVESAAWTLDLTILAGPHKGEVVTVTAVGLGGSEFDLIGMPGTLTVENGRPSFRIDG